MPPITSPVGVLSGTRHEAFIRTYFKDIEAKSFETRQQLYTALTDKDIKALFDDAMTASFWLSSQASKNCCRFVGGTYYSDEYFGEGLRAAFKPGDEKTEALVNFALQQIVRSGKIQEIYLKHFPVGFF